MTKRTLLNASFGFGFGLLACTPLPTPPEGETTTGSSTMEAPFATESTSDPSVPTGDAEPQCGDGVANPDNPKYAEQCDGSDLGEYDGKKVTDCSGLPQGGQVGDLTCREDCKWDTTQCKPKPANCQNKQFDLGEECDGSIVSPGDPFVGQTCSNTTAGQFDGQLACNDDCTLNKLGCNVLLPQCGDGLVEGDEECEDDNEFGGDDCVICKLNICGDGDQNVNGPDNIEACDDGNTIDNDGCSAACKIEEG